MALLDFTLEVSVIASFFLGAVVGLLKSRVRAHIRKYHSGVWEELENPSEPVPIFSGFSARVERFISTPRYRELGDRSLNWLVFWSKSAAVIGFLTTMAMLVLFAIEFRSRIR